MMFTPEYNAILFKNHIVLVERVHDTVQEGTWTERIFEMAFELKKENFLVEYSRLTAG